MNVTDVGVNPRGTGPPAGPTAWTLAADDECAAGADELPATGDDNGDEEAKPAPDAAGPDEVDDDPPLELEVHPASKAVAPTKAMIIVVRMMNRLPIGAAP